MKLVCGHSRKKRSDNPFSVNEHDQRDLAIVQCIRYTVTGILVIPLHV